jgi:hypothetical protein
MLTVWIILCICDRNILVCIPGTKLCEIVSMEHDFHEEITRSSTNQEIPRLLWKRNVRKNPVLDLVRSHMSAAHSFTSHSVRPV